MPQPKIEKTKNTFSFLILHTSYGTLKYAQEILNHIQILLLKLLDIPFSEEEDVAASWLEKSNATCQWIVICIYVQLIIVLFLISYSILQMDFRVPVP